MVDDVGDDQPTWSREPGGKFNRLGQRRVVVVLHVAPQADVLFEAERVDRREVIEREPVIPHVGLSDVVPQQRFAPAPVHVDEVTQRLERAAVVEVRGPTELLIRQAGRRRQDPVVRPRVEPDEREQALRIHSSILCRRPHPEAHGPRRHIPHACLIDNQEQHEESGSRRRGLWSPPTSSCARSLSSSPSITGIRRATSTTGAAPVSPECCLSTAFRA